MLLYANRIHREFRSLKDYAENLRQKFERRAPVDDLLLDAKNLRLQVKRLQPLLPEGVRGEETLGRHSAWLVYWLEKSEPKSCATDIDSICDVDIPELEEAFAGWCGKEGYVDDELADAVGDLLLQRELDSAIRKAFITLKERICRVFDAPRDLDGEDLVNAVFGSKATFPPAGLDNSERQAIRNLLSGFFGTFRNPYAHTDETPSWPEADAIISMINHILSELPKWNVEDND